MVAKLDELFISTEAMQLQADHAQVIAAAFALLELPAPPFREELLDDGGASVLFLLDQSMETDDARLATEAYDRTWEQLHCGSWKGVRRVWRQAFGAASVLKAKHLAKSGQLKESLRELDMCLMMAGPYAVPCIHAMISAVERVIQDHEPLTHVASPTEGSTKRRRLLSPRGGPVVERLPTLRFPIPRVEMPSLEAFYRQYMLTDTPVILSGAMALWPALGLEDPSRSWRQLSYFRRVAGHRTVPVEVGSSYLEDDWSQRLMTVNEFIDRFLEPSDATIDQPIGYLAQHHLFEQIPALRKDIMTPDYCTLQRDQDGDAENDDDDVTVNAWFGPKSTVSPLHFDPKDNLLCQVVGAKYLRIYAPSESDKLYPVEGLLSNTSQVDVENPDPVKFPQFQDAQYVECVLQEGEMLYIPPQFWHFVRSLSTSFSVSFWWS